ncbi:DUF7661 family protein [Klebsiella grimontii]|uniref:DUF7661 family protein n=1 Tax=Klebsiella grimontii TaxID=2058152 RepID=UPI0015B142BA|nr:hypothetical protein [Klebsiella grimontii]MEB7546450.1 hypothetical protein [Klebsiella grimontii]UTJ44902.1 hypothetical protein NLZ17_13475 [Klebsiella grimontii]
MLIYNVFGRHIGVQRQGERWQLFRVDLTEAEIPGWLGDIFHEAASPRHPDVRLVV